MYMRNKHCKPFQPLKLGGSYISFRIFLSIISLSGVIFLSSPHFLTDIGKVSSQRRRLVSPLPKEL